MAAPRDSLVAKVCLNCGDKGDTKLLICCRKCQDSAVHHYCVGSFSPDDDNINWWCWDCAPSKAESLRKSKRIITKKQKIQNTRNYWKDRLMLNRTKRLVQDVNGINGTDQSTTTFHLPIPNVETQLLNERRSLQDISEEKKAIPEIPSQFEEQNESIEIDETQKIQEVGKKKRILVLNESDDSQDEGKTIDFQLPTLVANDDCTPSETLIEQPSLGPDYSLSAEPVNDPIWRGWFNVKEESETCIGILAHLSNKARSKVSDAATAIPPVLDIQVLEKRVVWPKKFRVSPPTAASIALYFFPACERDERAFDSLLDEVIERDLALKAMINNVELLIFSSCELPLEHWRYKFKYFLWGVFRQKQCSHSSIETATSLQQNSSTGYSGLSQPKLVSNNKDVIHSESVDHISWPSQINHSPLSRNSSQASNLLMSKHSTPDSESPPFGISGQEKTVEEQKFEGGNQACDDSKREEDKLGCFVVETENCYKSCELYLRLHTDNGSAAEVVRV